MCIRTPKLNTPYTETPAHFALNNALQVLERCHTLDYLKKYTSLIVPLIAGQGFGRTRLLLNVFDLHDNSKYFSFGRIDNTQSFPKASTAWRSRFTPTTSFFEGVYYVVGLISTIYLIPSSKEDFVDNSEAYHQKIIRTWIHPYPSKQTDIMSQIHSLISVIQYNSEQSRLQEGRATILLDEVDSLVDTLIEKNSRVWDCMYSNSMPQLITGLVIAVGLIQRQFAESNDRFHCVVALSPSSLRVVHPGQRQLQISNMDNDSNIPNQWYEPVTEFYTVPRPSGSETDNIDTVCLDVLVSGRPKWGQYYHEHVSDGNPPSEIVKKKLFKSAQQFVINCLSLNQQNSESWIGGALSYILIPEQLMATATEEDMSLSSFSLVHVHPESRMVTFYRHSDVLLTTIIWSIIEKHNDNKLVSSLLQHILPRPFDEECLGLALANVAMMLILRTIHNTEADVPESYWRSI
ncbi:hypothetical protein GEMRC1_011160 [Eukaryota sp. GEM-RC1]